MNTIFTETENQIRLRRAKDGLNIARENEAAARKALNDAIESRKRAKARYEHLFVKEEAEEFARRMSNYRHKTKT